MTGNTKLEIRNAELEAGSSVLVEKQSSIDNPKSTLPLLLEAGCEEIPARFLSDAARDLGLKVKAALEENRLLPEASTKGARKPAVATFYTPRRLVVHVRALLAQQPDKVEEVVGPPVKVAVDVEGKYTRAAESFVQKNSAQLQDLLRTTTAKGEYLALSKTTRGRPAAEILAAILPPVILGLSFPKSMYWTGKSAPRFVRPIRWVVAVLGEGKQAATVEFEMLGVKSGNFTYGHRVKGSKPLVVTGFKNYSKKLAQAFVEIDPAKRLERIKTESQALVEKAGFNLLADEWLADWIVNATEWPRPMFGNFDERFLHLPREILITVMRDHQRYFAVEKREAEGAEPGEAQKLAPHFVAVLNMDSDEKGMIQQGHERVITARFRDAEFFWSADQKTSLRHRVPLLDKVTYQVKLGSYGDKVRRVSKLAESIGVKLEDVGILNSRQRGRVLEAVKLAKCDLTTQMVQEFTELQGVVGGLYAAAQGEPREVAVAIYDHYLPVGAEGASPRTIEGAVVSLADKLDSVIGGFAVGNEPSGSSDPFGLRRQANAIIKVILEFNLPISPLGELLDISFQSLVATLEGRGREPVREFEPRLKDFFRERLSYYLESVRGFRYDTVRAVIAAGYDLPADACTRAQAMESLRGSEDFAAISAAAKRIRNILSKSASAADWHDGEVEVPLLSELAERELFDAYQRVERESASFRAARGYRQALEVISTLRPVVDHFFDKVMVMAEESGVRQNRLRLLKKLDALFSGIAHFAEIA